MSDSPGDPSDFSEEDQEPPLPKSDCEIDGHYFEGNDSLSERCIYCGYIRNYATREQTSERAAVRTNVYVCSIDGGHVYGGPRGECMYCGKRQ